MTPRHARRRGHRRAGFTLPEMLVSSTIMLAVIAMVVPFFRAQTRVMARSAGRIEVQQNLNYAMSAAEIDLRAGGTNLAVDQPLVVHAAAMSVTVNADLVSRVGTALGAIYFDSTADSASTRVMRLAERRTLPTATSTWQYPRREYGGSAETVSYYLVQDTVSNRSGEFMLMRRINATAPRMIARSIVVPTGEQPFRYFKADTMGRLVEIPSANLPIWHDSSRHGGSATESAMSRRIDSIRVIRVRLNSVFRDPRGALVQRALERTIRLNNAFASRVSSCGGAPLSPELGALSAPTGGTPQVLVRWDDSDDENGGARDVEMYSIYRRPSTATAWPNEPIASVPAGVSSGAYEWTDVEVQSGQSWRYGITAMDCARQISPVHDAGAVTVP